MRGKCNVVHPHFKFPIVTAERIRMIVAQELLSDWVKEGLYNETETEAKIWSDDEESVIHEPSIQKIIQESDASVLSMEGNGRRLSCFQNRLPDHTVSQMHKSASQFVRNTLCSSSTGCLPGRSHRCRLSSSNSLYPAHPHPLLQSLPPTLSILHILTNCPLTINANIAFCPI